jgi:hypothetical protein
VTAGEGGRGFFQHLMDDLSERQERAAASRSWWDEPAPLYDARGFDPAGVHRETGTRFDRYGRDVDGFDARGFNKEGINRVTGTAYAPSGYDWYGRDKNGYDRRGFDLEGLHKDTGTRWSPDGFDAHGKNQRGIYRWQQAARASLNKIHTIS